VITRLPPGLVAELLRFRASYRHAELCRIDLDAAPRPYVRIAAAILDDIDKGVLKPGDQVPARVKLAEQHNVSISTAAKAVRLLAMLSLIELDGNAYWVCDSARANARGLGYRELPTTIEEIGK
jgi:DNA-binding transcriptional regulator YhcF (GntR family)